MSDNPPEGGNGTTGPPPGGPPPYPGPPPNPGPPPAYPGPTGYPPPGGGYAPPGGGYGPPGGYGAPPGYGPPGGYPAPTGYGGSYASFGIRLGAWLIDFVILFVVFYILDRVFDRIRAGRITFTNNTTTNGVLIHHVGHISVIAWLLQIVIVLLYGGLLCGSVRGQTPGMMVVGVRAVDAQGGGSIGFGRAVGRAAFEYLLAVVLFLPWVVDMLFPLWDANRQTLHDKVTRTVVIRTTGGPPT